MKELRYIRCDYSYADYSNSISPAIERALEDGDAPSTWVLNTFTSDSITSGILDDAEKAIDLVFCREHGIVVRRRQNTGGAIFGPKGGAFICLYLNPKAMDLPLTNIAKAFPIYLEGMAEAINEKWGLAAVYRPLNDVQVDGRKLVASSARLEKGILTIRSLINVVKTERRTLDLAIRTIEEKVQDKEIKNLGRRFTCLEDELGRQPDKAELEEVASLSVEKIFKGEVGLREGFLTPTEENYFKEYQEKFNSEEYLYGNSERIRFRNAPPDAVKSEGRHKAVAGLVRVTLLKRNGRIHDLIVTGDFHPSPYSVLKEIEDALRGKECDLDVARRTLEEIYARPGVEMAGIEADDFIVAFQKAFQ